MPATVLAERVGWSRSPAGFRDNVARIRRKYAPADPADRISHEPGSQAQCDPHSSRAGCPRPTFGWAGTDARPTEPLTQDKAAILALPLIPPVTGVAARVRPLRDCYVRMGTKDYSVHPRAVGRFVYDHHCPGNRHDQPGRQMRRKPFQVLGRGHPTSFCSGRP